MSRGRWRTKPAPGYIPAGHPDSIEHAEKMAAAAAALAPRLGFCGNCGATVNEEKGELHHPDCIVPDDRKCFHEWQPSEDEDRRPFCSKCGRRKTAA